MEKKISYHLNIITDYIITWFKIPFLTYGNQYISIYSYTIATTYAVLLGFI